MTIQVFVDSCKDNLIGILCEEMKSFVAVYYPEFALATALTILQGVTQRAFIPPGGHLVGYHILVGPPGCGKNDYLSFASMYLRAVDEKIVAREPRSGEAIKATLAEFPSRVLIADEVGAIISEGSNPRSRDPVAKSICNLWLELWSPRDVLAGSMAKDTTKRVDDVYHPRWSMLGAMTASDLTRICGIPEFGSKGLFSRICMWVIPHALQPAYNPSKGAAKPVDSTISALRDLEAKGRVKGILIGEDGTSNAWLAAPKELITWEDRGGPLDPLFQFKVAWDGLGARVSRYDASQLDVASGVIGRAKAKALTFACLHAVACGRQVLLLRDVTRGCALASGMLEADLHRLNMQAPEDSARDLVMAKMQAHVGHAMSVGALRREIRALKDQPRKFAEEVVGGMVRDGLLTLEKVGRNGAQYVSLPTGDPDVRSYAADEPLTAFN